MSAGIALIHALTDYTSGGTAGEWVIKVESPTPPPPKTFLPPVSPNMNDVKEMDKGGQNLLGGGGAELSSFYP